MSSFLTYLKNSNLQVPIPIGKVIAKAPFSMRPGIGRVYKEQYDNIEKYKKFSYIDRQEFIFKRFYKVFKHAYLNIPFYADLYKSKGVLLKDIRDFKSISKLPIISKADLMNVPLEYRSYPVKGRSIVNTGGSSGKPLSFYMDPIRFGNEWAHIHKMWSRLGFKPSSSLKLNFDGRSNVKNLVQYDFVRHSIRFDVYANKFNACKKLLDITVKNDIEYLHGYPSAIYEFALHCEKHEPLLLETLIKSLKGAFLSSEYPSPYYRNVIERVFNIPTQSFYGHTETCVMAYEYEKFEYKAFQTYGYAEGVEQLDSSTNLIGTSYFNFASPLIRYNTEDKIEVLSSENGVLENFKITGGRIGDFITDKSDSKIPLTGLIFGRHHKIFDICHHVQIREDSPGYATIFYVSGKIIDNINTYFDSSNVDIDFSFKRIDNPILTKAGKIKLLITDEDA